MILTQYEGVDAGHFSGDLVRRRWLARDHGVKYHKREAVSAASNMTILGIQNC